MQMHMLQDAHFFRVSGAAPFREVVPGQLFSLPFPAHDDRPTSPIQQQSANPRHTHGLAAPGPHFTDALYVLLQRSFHEHALLVCLIHAAYMLLLHRCAY